MWAPLLLLLVAGAQPAPATPPPAAGTDVLGYAGDATQRMTVPVRIGEAGPFRFIVDTGAERTILSEELAGSLGLPAGAAVRLGSTTGVVDADTVLVPQLALGRRRVESLAAPTLRRAHLGADGLIGVDSLQHAQVRFDFVRRTLSIAPSAGMRERRVGANPVTRFSSQPGLIVVTARNRLGRLIVTNAEVDGERIDVVIDTGAEVSIGNPALQRSLAAHGRLGPSRPVTLLSVTGGTLAADYALTDRLRVGGVTIAHLSIAYAPSPVFAQLGLDERPALLLGMDALQLFDSITIDFAHRQVRFQEPMSALPPSARYAVAARD